MLHAGFAQITATSWPSLDRAFTCTTQQTKPSISATECSCSNAQRMQSVNLCRAEISSRDHIHHSVSNNCTETMKKSHLLTGADPTLHILLCSLSPPTLSRPGFDPIIFMNPLISILLQSGLETYTSHSTKSNLHCNTPAPTLPSTALTKINHPPSPQSILIP